MEYSVGPMGKSTYESFGNDFFNGFGNFGNSSWVIISLIVAFIAAILIFFLFLNKKNENRFSGFGKWLYEFLNFRKLFLEGFLKFIYLISAFFITLYSFSVIGENFVGFLLILVFGNIILRCFYELVMMLLIICRNTNEINAKTVKYNDPYVTKNENTDNNDDLKIEK